MNFSLYFLFNCVIINNVVINCRYHSKSEYDVLSWSSGQDASLSRWNQGFDSPWEYQLQGTGQRPVLLLCIHFTGGVEAERVARFGEPCQLEHG